VLDQLDSTSHDLLSWCLGLIENTLLDLAVTEPVEVKESEPKTIRGSSMDFNTSRGPIANGGRPYSTSSKSPFNSDGKYTRAQATAMLDAAMANFALPKRFNL